MTPEAVAQNVAETLETMMPHHGYCLAPTHYLQDNTPVENVIAMYQTAQPNWAGTENKKGRAPTEKDGFLWDALKSYSAPAIIRKIRWGWTVRHASAGKCARTRGATPDGVPHHSVHRRAARTGGAGRRVGFRPDRG